MVIASVLRVLHRIHQQLGDLRERLDRGPKRMRDCEMSVENLRQDLEKGEGETRQTKMAADAKQLELKAHEDKVVDWKTKLNACGTNKEYQALLDQIAAAEMASSVLADEILELLERIDVLNGGVHQAGENVAAAVREMEQTRQKVAAATEGIQGDIRRLERELQEAEETLPGDLRPDYDRVARARGADALAAVDSEFCGGCFRQLQPNMLNTLALGRPVFCTSCGRLLYSADDTTPGKEDTTAPGKDDATAPGKDDGRRQ